MKGCLSITTITFRITNLDINNRLGAIAEKEGARPAGRSGRELARRAVESEGQVGRSVGRTDRQPLIGTCDFD